MLKISLKISVHTLVLLRRVALALGLLLALAAAGMILTLRYWVLPDIEHYHDSITHAVGNAIGLAVEIGRIEADWHGIGPHLRLSDIHVLDKQQRTILALKRVDVVVSWMTLLTGELRLASLEIDQPNLMIKRDVHGVLHISGVQLEEDTANNNFANMLLNQSRIMVRGAHISWLDEKQAAPLLVFDQVNLIIENDGNHHRFAMRATPPAALSTQLDVRGDFYGKSFDDLSGWSGEIFTQLAYADLAAWKPWLPLPAALKQGSGALRGWLEVKEGKVSRVTTDLALVEVQTRLAENLPQLDIHVLSGRLGWRDVPLGLEVSLEKFSFKLFNGFVLKPTDVFVSLSNLSHLSNLQGIESSSGDIHANLIELDGLAKMMKYLPLDSQFKNKYAEFSPQGTVEGLQLKWQTDAAKQLHYKVKGRFDGLSLQRVGKLPGFSGLSGEVDGNESSGSLSINSQKLLLDAPQFMPEPLVFDTIVAQSSWKAKSGEFEVKLRNLAVANADIAGTANGSYQTLADSPGKLDLNVHLDRAAVLHAGKYIPLAALGTNARSGLNKALLNGQFNNSTLRLKGELKDFPFVDNKKGIFKIHARAKGVALEYAPEWPRIDNANVDLLIQGKELLLTSASAMAAGVRLKNVRVAIPDMLHEDLMLKMQLEAEGDNARALAYIHASPLREYLDIFTDDFAVRGKGKLNLKLDIPLRGSQQLKVAGTYHFTDSEIEVGKYLPTIRRVNGDLLFTESGVSAKNIVAQILGGPAKLVMESGEGGAINARLGGRANFSALHKINPHPAWGKLSGEPEWNVEVAVQNKLVRVLLSSRLSGLQSDFPAPFAKRADEAVSLRLEMKDLSLVRDAWTMQYGSLLNANLLRQKNDEGVWSVDRGIINFANVAQKADRYGVWVTGTLPQVSLEGWSVLAGVVDGDGGAAVRLTGGSLTGGSLTGGSLAGADLLIQKLSGYGNNVNDLHLKASSRNDVLKVQLASREVNGELSWQSENNGKLVAKLKNLDLEFSVANSGPKTQVETNSKSKADARAGVNAQAGINAQTKIGSNIDFPDLDLTVEKFSFKGRQLGKLELQARQQKQDFMIDHLRLINPDGVLHADGKWRLQEDNMQTQLNVKLDIGNAGNMLSRSGFPNSVKNGSGKLEGNFNWPGTPWMYSNAKLNGQLNLDMEKGQFLQIDPGIGKMLSILSLQALPKRITLDFEDVFSKGFEFDSIKGSADFKQGVINTDNLKIEGSSAKVTMKGKINLVNETQDLKVRIVPTVGNSAALISALVATPVVGVGVFIVSKILGDPLGQLAAFEYNISGSWVDPKVEKIGEVKPAK